MSRRNGLQISIISFGVALHFTVVAAPIAWAQGGDNVYCYSQKTTEQTVYVNPASSAA